MAAHRIVAGERTIPVRIGLNKGHVFAGDVGPTYRRTYTVMGDAVNLAARVMARAEPGQLLATKDVREVRDPLRPHPPRAVLRQGQGGTRRSVVGRGAGGIEEPAGRATR